MKCGNNGRYHVPYSVIRLLLSQGQYDRKIVVPTEDLIRRKNRDTIHSFLSEAKGYEQISEYMASFQSISNTGLCRFTMKDGELCMEMSDKATEILNDKDEYILKRFGRLFPKWTATRASGNIHSVR